MSNRFYINGFQVFGDNEIGAKTVRELDRQGIVWKEHGWICKRQKIKEIQPLMDAINNDILTDLKTCITHKYDTSLEKYVDVDFKEVKDTDLFCNEIIPKMFTHVLYRENGEIKRNSWTYAYMFLENKKALIPTLLYLHIKDKCIRTVKDEIEVIEIKPKKSIWVEMY